MKIETTTLQALTLRDVPGLDPVTAILRDLAPGKGQLIVECYGKAWSAFWGAMGAETVSQFVRTASPGYVENCLINGPRGSMLRIQERHQMAYLTRIVEALRSALLATGAAQ